MRHQILLLFCLMCCANGVLAQLDADGLPILLDGVPRKVHQVPVVDIKEPLAVYEDSLIFFADSLGIGDDVGKLAAAQYMIRLMRSVLRSKSSFAYPFTRLSKRISIVQPKGKRFRIYNWDFSNNNGENRYYGVVQFANGKIFPLIDISGEVLRQQEDTVLTDRKWYGANYYNIIPGDATQPNRYFALGYNQGNPNSKKKLIECMTVIGDSALVFGAPVFESPVYKNQVKNRFILEYNILSSIGCNWDGDRQMIVYDHLESNIGDLKKRYTFVPDGTYDGLTWDGKHWRVNNSVVQFEDRAQKGAVTDPKKEGIVPRQFVPETLPEPPSNGRKQTK